MAKIRCFLIEPTDRVQQRLRRYSGVGTWISAEQRWEYPDPCPANNGHNHEASVAIEDAPAQFDEHGYVINEGDEWPQDDPRWPQACKCGHPFTDADPKRLFVELLYRRVDTGETCTLRSAPHGAMWRDQHRTWVRSQDAEPPLVVKTPGGEWGIDDCSTSCNHPNQPHPDGHHCWTRTGTPPNVTARPSILIKTPPAYHGFLTDGALEDT